MWVTKDTRDTINNVLIIYQFKNQKVTMVKQQRSVTTVTPINELFEHATTLAFDFLPNVHLVQIFFKFTLHFHPCS